MGAPNPKTPNPANWFFQTIKIGDRSPQTGAGALPTAPHRDAQHWFIRHTERYGIVSTNAIFLTMITKGRKDERAPAQASGSSSSLWQPQAHHHRCGSLRPIIIAVAASGSSLWQPQAHRFGSLRLIAVAASGSLSHFPLVCGHAHAHSLPPKECAGGCAVPVPCYPPQDPRYSYTGTQVHCVLIPPYPAPPSH